MSVKQMGQGQGQVWDLDLATDASFWDNQASHKKPRRDWHPPEHGQHAGGVDS